MFPNKNKNDFQSQKLVDIHPFIDGNKRTGAVAAAVFLEMNNFELAAPERDFERLVRKVASGSAGKTVVARFLSSNSRSTRSLE